MEKCNKKINKHKQILFINYYTVSILHNYYSLYNDNYHIRVML